MAGLRLSFSSPGVYTSRPAATRFSVPRAGLPRDRTAVSTLQNMLCRDPVTLRNFVVNTYKVREKNKLKGRVCEILFQNKYLVDKPYLGFYPPDPTFLFAGLSSLNRSFVQQLIQTEEKYHFDLELKQGSVIKNTYFCVIKYERRYLSEYPKQQKTECAVQCSLRCWRCPDMSDSVKLTFPGPGRLPGRYSQCKGHARN